MHESAARTGRPTSPGALGSRVSRQSHQASPTWGTRIVALLAMANLAMVMFTSWLVWSVSERWWLGSVATYAPRELLLVSTGLLALVSLLWHRPSLLFHLFAGLWVILGVVDWSLAPLMEPEHASRFLEETFDDDNDPAPEPMTGRLRIASCNVQDYQPAFGDVLRDLEELPPDVVAFQESRSINPLCEDYFADWHKVQVEYFFVASKWPLEVLGHCDDSPFERSSGLVVKVAHPEHPFALANVHLMTARPGLRELTPGSILRGDGPAELAALTLMRSEEMQQLRHFIENARNGLPLIVVGDFNTPASSHVFQEAWGDLTGGFETAAIGPSHTAPCRPISFWPGTWPWSRIDHIRVTPEWKFHQFVTGDRNGSDHRLVACELELLPFD